ncbi:MAG: hypothetical protein WCZ90_12525 [Melioribacteraceae bacterium]
MGKLKLNLDEIKVESFEVSNNVKVTGTVFGQETGGGSTCPPMCEYTVEYGSCVGTCDTEVASCGATCVTCDATCPVTCPVTCLATCGDSCTCATYEFPCSEIKICNPV